MVSATLASLLGALLMTSGLGTWSEWRVHDEQDMGRISAGSVSLSGTLEVQLLSRQPVNSRTFASGTTCPAPSPYVQCRVVTASLANERLIPGDTVRVTREVSLSGAGNNLAGNLTFDATQLINQSAPQLSQVASATLTVTRPDSGQISGTGMSRTQSVRRSTAGDFGTYVAVATIATPVSNAGVRWDNTLFSQTMDLGQIKVTFTQTK